MESFMSFHYHVVKFRENFHYHVVKVRDIHEIQNRDLGGF